MIDWEWACDLSCPSVHVPTPQSDTQAFCLEGWLEIGGWCCCGIVCHQEGSHLEADPPRSVELRESQKELVALLTEWPPSETMPRGTSAVRLCFREPMCSCSSLWWSVCVCYTHSENILTVSISFSTMVFLQSSLHGGGTRVGEAS